jgi:hypothetical protein
MNTEILRRPQPREEGPTATPGRNGFTRLLARLDGEQRPITFA